MRNRVSRFKQYVGQPGVSSRLRHRLTRSSAVRYGLLGALAVSLAGAPGAQEVQLPGRADPALAAAFLPRHAPAGAYQLSVLDAPLEAARDRMMAALAPEARVDDPPGAWAITRAAELIDAFGDAGLYSPSRLARLYTGRPVFVLRAPIVRAGRVVASLTLISPHPDARLTQLRPGTMAILFLADKARGDRAR